MSAPVLLAALCMVKNVQGVSALKKSGVVAALGAAILVCVTQLAIGMAFSYTDLAHMLGPVYTLNLSVLREGYYFRLDKLLLFIWLGAQLVSIAFMIFVIARIAMRDFGLRATMPAILPLLALIFCALIYDHFGGMDFVHRIQVWLDQHAYLFLLPPLSAVALAALRHKEGHKEEKGEDISHEAL
jgi:hypothetical protein